VLGKSHRDDRPTLELPGGIQDGRATADELQAGSTWPYWSYIRQALERVYGDWRTGWKVVARSNLVKCTSVRKGMKSADVTTNTMRNQCMRELGVVRQELRLLKPDMLILLTGEDYDEYIPCLSSSPADGVRWLGDQGHKIPCGEKRLLTQEFTIELDSRTIFGLRLGHPERMKKNQYVAHLANWWRSRSREISAGRGR
jgi:hypothetical protein